MPLAPRGDTLTQKRLRAAQASRGIEQKLRRVQIRGLNRTTLLSTLAAENGIR